MARIALALAVVALAARGAHADDAIQRIADEELARAVRDWSPRAAFVVVQNWQTGEIVALAGKGYDRAIVTGSTLKSFTIAAALDAGVVKGDERFDCATRTYPDGALRDPTPHGMLSVEEVLTVSSNPGASRIGDLLGIAKLTAALSRFHFGPLPEVKPGTRASGAYPAGELAELTPLQMAAAYAALFADGEYRVPGKKAEAAVRPETARRVVAMLEAAVATGTGTAARVADHRVAGKTGTGVIGKDRYASFVGTVRDGPPLVILVGLVAPKRGGTGPTAAAPVFARIATRLVARP